MNLKELRKSKGMSQDDLSRISGVNKMQISRVERGDTDIKNMTLINALRIADALGVDPHILIEEDSNVRKEWVKGYEGLYSVTEDGRVFSHKSNRYLTSESTARYLTVSLQDSEGTRNVYAIHRLVAEAFIPNPGNLPVVHHKDANTRNNHVSNLEWVTQKENVHECIENGNFGKMNRGNKSEPHETEEEFVNRIRDLMQK